MRPEHVWNIHQNGKFIWNFDTISYVAPIPTAAALFYELVSFNFDLDIFQIEMYLHKNKLIANFCYCFSFFVYFSRSIFETTNQLATFSYK